MNLCRFGLFVCLFFSLFSFGCSDETINPQAKEDLDSGLRAYRAGDNRQAIARADTVLSSSSQGSLAMQAYYLRGMAWYRLKDFSQAQRDLEHVDRRSKNVQLCIRAMDSLGEIAYRRDDMLRAESYFRQVIELAEREQKPVDHAHYRLGCVLQRLGKWQEADVHFQRVIFLFGQSKLARQARARVNGRKWTIQIGSYSKRQNASVAAKPFREAKMKTCIEPAIRNGRMTFLLQVGRWEKYKQAAGQLEAVRRMKTDAFLQVTR
jgi:tetratricopeptide (TPR) repeat protein